MVELPEKEVIVKSEEWATKAMVVRSLGQRVFVETMACKFRLLAKLKEDVAAFNLEHGHIIF